MVPASIRRRHILHCWTTVFKWHTIHGHRTSLCGIRIWSSPTDDVIGSTGNWTGDGAWRFWVRWHACVGHRTSVSIRSTIAHHIVHSAIYWTMCWTSCSRVAWHTIHGHHASLSRPRIWLSSTVDFIGSTGDWAGDGACRFWVRWHACGGHLTSISIHSTIAPHFIHSASYWTMCWASCSRVAWHTIHGHRAAFSRPRIWLSTAEKICTLTFNRRNCRTFSSNKWQKKGSNKKFHVED